MGDKSALSKLASLPSTKGYPLKDRFHDFRRLFTGSAEGQRVLAEILSWGHMLQPSSFGNPIDPYLLAIFEGERNLALRLFATINNEPKEKLQRARSRE